MAQLGIENMSAYLRKMAIDGYAVKPDLPKCREPKNPDLPSEMEQKLRIQSEESLRLYQKRLAQAEKRIGELDRLFIRIYEDNVAGRLDDERFAMMSKSYTEEQKDLKAEVKGLQQQIHEQEQQAENIEQFVQRVKRKSTLTELTTYALRELVKAVYVDAPDKSSGKRRQKVHIEYDLVGYIPVDELLKAEQA